MMRVAVEWFGSHNPQYRLDLYDLRPDALAEVARSLPVERVHRAAIDLFDPVMVREAVAGADLVVLGAGPYIRTAEPVLAACIERRVDYLDFDDDVESTRASLALSDRAREAGIAGFIGCGISPGMTNVLAADVADQLDQVDTLDVCWVTGDEGARPYGAAVIEHVLHIGAGNGPQWRDGRHVSTETFGASEVFPMGGALGDYRLYEVAHPEPITLPRRYPRARSIRVLGSVHPLPVVGICKGVAEAVLAGRLSKQDATEWFQAVTQDKAGSAAVWRYALRGMWGQQRRGEITLSDMVDYLRRTVRKEHPPFAAGILATATGLKDGTQVRVTSRSPLSGPSTVMGASMAAATGIATAAFMTLALRQQGQRHGVLAPEDWVTPRRYWDTLAGLGVPPDEVVDPDYEIGTP